MTIKDIRKACGVSVSTVSRALNNHPDINPETKQKIMEVIENTGFVPNDSARYLKRTDANNIALVVKGITNPLFSQMIRIMEDKTHNAGYETILRHVGPMEDEVSIAQVLVKSRKLKGIVFLGGAFTHDENAVKTLGVPFVFSTIGNRERRYSNVAIDDLEAAYTATKYLIDKGHRNIGIITEGLSVPSIGELRLSGYKKALSEAKIQYNEKYVYEITEGIEHYTMGNGYAAAGKLIKNAPELTAIFCISDVLAIGACRAVRDSGRKIPRDISIMGFDGIEEGDYFLPRITTMSQPTEKLADETINILLDMIENEAEPKNVVMKAELIEKESVLAV